MKIPTPSFFKIRVVAMLVGFLVMCFVIGWMKNAFAACNCYWIEYNIISPYPYSNNTSKYSVSLDLTSCPVSINATYLGMTNRSSEPSLKRLELRVYINTENGWYISINESYAVTTIPDFPDSSGPFGSRPDSCPLTCDEKKTQLITQCGGESKIIWNPDTCEGECLPEKCETAKLLYERACDGEEGIAWQWTNLDECKAECLGCEGYIDSFTDYCTRMGGTVNWNSYSPTECAGLTCTTPECDEPGQETFNEATSRCDELHKPLTKYLKEECRGICGCTEEEYISEKNKCGAAGMIAFSDITCKGICGSCQDVYRNAKEDCEAAGGTLYNFQCNEENGVIIGVPDWDCKGASNVIDPKEDPAKIPDSTPDKPETGETPATEKTPDPEQPSSDPWLEAIKGELGNQTDQGDKIIANGNRANSLLEWIGDSIGTLNGNLGKVLDAITGKSDQLSDDVGDIKDDVGNIADTLDNISSGEYASPEDEDAYSVPEHDFNERTSQFLTQMKSTGIFSLPDSIASSIPGGGSPLLNIETGDTFGGTQQIDFSTWSTGLLALRGIFQIMGMIIAIRIVTLKR